MPVFHALAVFCHGLAHLGDATDAVPPAGLEAPTGGGELNRRPPAAGQAVAAATAGLLARPTVYDFAPTPASFPPAAIRYSSRIGLPPK